MEIDVVAGRRARAKTLAEMRLSRLIRSRDQKQTIYEPISRGGFSLIIPSPSPSPLGLYTCVRVFGIAPQSAVLLYLITAISKIIGAQVFNLSVPTN